MHLTIAVCHEIQISIEGAKPYWFEYHKGLYGHYVLKTDDKRMYYVQTSRDISNVKTSNLSDPRIIYQCDFNDWVVGSSKKGKGFHRTESEDICRGYAQGIYGGALADPNTIWQVYDKKHMSAYAKKEEFIVKCVGK